MFYKNRMITQSKSGKKYSNFISNLFNKIRKFIIITIATVLVLIAILFIYLVARIIADEMTEDIYPSEFELGNSEWCSESSNFNLTIFDGNIYGEIITQEKIYDIRAWIPPGLKPLFDRSKIEIWYESYNNETNRLESRTIIYADYMYKDGKIVIDEMKFNDNYQNFSPIFEEVRYIIEFLKDIKEITLYKKREIDKTLVQKWECVETKMEFFTFDETDVYYYGRIPDSPFSYQNKEYEPIEILKSFDDYYYFHMRSGNYIYISAMKLERDEKEIVITILAPLNLEEEHKQYFSENISKLTFRKVEEKTSEDVSIDDDSSDDSKLLKN